MVRLADLVECDHAAHRNGTFNRISQKHVDFVLVGPVDGDIRLVVELDDQSHSQAKRLERDRLVDEILDRVGIPILRVRVASAYESEALRVEIFNCLQRSQASVRRAA